MSHTSGSILLHFIFIFSTQGRRPMIKPDFRGDLFAYLGGIVCEPFTRVEDIRVHVLTTTKFLISARP